jgi:hypothetical protein
LVEIYGSDREFPLELLGRLKDWEPKPWETFSPE